MHVKSCNHIITYIITFNIIISYDNHLTLSKRTHNGHKPNAHKLGRYILGARILELWNLALVPIVGNFQLFNSNPIHALNT